MSINFKLIIGSLALMLITVVVGLVSQDSQRDMRDLAARIYDQSLLPMRHLQIAESASSTLRGQYLALSAQGGDALKGALGEAEAAEFIQALRQILDSLRTAADSDMSALARHRTREIAATLSRLVASGGKVSRRLVLRDIHAATLAFNDTQAILEGDALALRRQVENTVQTAVRRSWIEMAAALGAALLITALLSLTITAPIRRAVRVAKALAAGSLTADIVPTGRGEAAELMLALAETQRGIAAYEHQKEELIAAQAHGYDAEIALQNSRFEAAMNNMSQGLCMFDKRMKLLVFNEPFALMFGRHPIETPAREVLADPRLHSILSSQGGESCSFEMPDGQILLVKRRGMSDRGFVLTFENVTEQHRTAERLAHVAGHDGLTDLPNRRQFCERLEAVLAAKGRRGNIAVFCLDLNGFKAVNDAFGHPAGDALLIAVGRTLLGCVGESGLVARLGGDEFAVIQTDADPAATEGLAERIVAALSQPFDIGGRRIATGVSIGIHTVGPRAPAAELVVQTILKNCDLALYEAKLEKGGGWRVFASGMRDRITAQRTLEIDLAAALQRQEFQLFYQPFVDVEKGGVSGFEALLRWRHPVRGMVSPAEFIPVAENLGLINEIGRWALETACAMAATWPANLNISVNLSPVQMTGAGLVGIIDRALAASGLDPRRLQLEVTESVFLDKTEELLATLTALRERGILVAMDDFGTGYSSLGYLSRFPFSKLKIDQSFVRDLGKPENIAIVRAVISLSKAMNMAVIAEGIETREQCDILYAEGCREMQGYFFSKPRPAHDLAKVLAEVGRRWTKPASALLAEPLRAPA